MADKVKPKVTYLWLTRDCTGIKLEIEGICRVKRTGLPNGLKWEVVK